MWSDHARSVRVVHCSQLKDKDILSIWYEQNQKTIYDAKKEKDPNTRSYSLV